MKLNIDKIARTAKFLTSTSEYGDVRRYYEIGTTLVLCRNNLDLTRLIGHTVDALVGWDTAYPGFTTDEEMIGKRRTKVTIFRVVVSGPAKTLSRILEKTNE